MSQAEHRSLVVKNGVRESVPEDFQVGSDFYDALSNEVRELIEDATRRAEENGRSTIKPRDL